jgi:hypothetical protein
VKKEKPKEKLRLLLKERKRIDEDIAKLEKELVKELCPKGKLACEPAYCTFRYTDTCPFLKEWRSVSQSP